MGLLVELESKYDFDIIDDFMTHFGVMSLNLEPLIVGLERKESFEKNSKEIVKIFKNINSAANFLKLEPLSKFTKLCLNICEELSQNSNCIASDELVDWLLLAAEQIEEYRKDIENDEVYFKIINPKLIKTPFELVKR